MADDSFWLFSPQQLDERRARVAAGRRRVLRYAQDEEERGL